MLQTAVLLFSAGKNVDYCSVHSMGEWAEQTALTINNSKQEHHERGMQLLVKFAVCDDEREMVDYISDKLHEYYPEECEIRKYTDGRSLLSDSRDEDFDALFLDICMPNLDGMALAEKFREFNQNVKIIFVTNNNELAYKGYIYDAFRYVRKSKLEQELCEAARSLINYFVSLGEYLNFKTPNGEITKSVKSIKCFEVKGHTVTMVCDQSADRVCGTLKEYEERLNNMGFIRIHKSYLVNYRYIYAVQNSNVKLTCGRELPLSRNRADMTKKKLLEFSKNRAIKNEFAI